MGNSSSNVLSHFAPFHEWLDEIVKLSDLAFPEGGMNWRVNFSKRKSDLDNKILSVLKDKHQFSSLENTKKINMMWSKFYWNAAGLGWSLQNLSLTEEWSAEEAKLTLDHLRTVDFVAALFVSAQANGYWISCEEDPVGMKISSVTLFGKRVLEHDIYWSVD